VGASRISSPAPCRDGIEWEVCLLEKLPRLSLLPGDRLCIQAHLLAFSGGCLSSQMGEILEVALEQGRAGFRSDFSA